MRYLRYSGFGKEEQLAGPQLVWSTLLTDAGRQSGRSAISGSAINLRTYGVMYKATWPGPEGAEIRR
jgi:hypothetical protein